MATTRLINPTTRLINPKPLTRDEVSRRQERAVNFARNVVGDPDLAEELANMSVEEYALRKNFRLGNPQNEKETRMNVRQDHTSGLTEDEVRELRQIIRQSRSTSTERAERVTNPTRVSNPGMETSQGPSQGPSPTRTARLAKRLRSDREDLIDAIEEIADLLDAEDYEAASEVVDDVLCEYEDEE